MFNALSNLFWNAPNLARLSFTEDNAVSVVIAARAKEDVDFPIDTFELAIDNAPKKH